MVQIIMSDDEGVSTNIVAINATNKEEFVYAVNENTADMWCQYESIPTAKDYFIHMFAEKLEDENGINIGESGLTVKIIDLLIKEYSFVDGDSRDRIQLFIF